MPYISTEDVRAKRQAIKKAFPGFKFSITKHNHSEMSVAVLEAPFQMLTKNQTNQTHQGVNHFYIDDDYKDEPRIRDVLKKIYTIMDGGNRIVSEDGDYGSIPQFYTNISIGEWDKPFIVR